MTFPRRLARGLCCTAIVWGACAVAGAATLPDSEDVPVVGGRVALARSLGIDPVPDRPRFVAELARIVYNTPEGKSAATDELLGRISRHLDVVERFQTFLATVEPQGGGIALSMAARTSDRGRLKDFLDLVGLKLQEKNKRLSVERTNSKQGADRLRLLTDLGVDLAQLATRLNQGETVRVEVPTESVPIPLPLAVWSSAVFRHPVALPQLFAAVLSDRRAALLCHGLAGLDEPTLRFLAEHPEIVTRVYEHDASAFAAFGDALRIRDGRVVTPGDAGARSMWEGILDSPVTRPDRFVRELFSRDNGRLVYLYDTISHLDPPRARFALGLWMADQSERTDRFGALVSEEAGANPAWDIKTHPFARPPGDVALLLAQMEVAPSGAPAAPSARRLWDRAFSGADLPTEPAKELGNLNADGRVDAAWLLSALGDASKARAERLDQLGLGQRVFAAATDRELPDVLVALRAVVRYRMLMLTLERMGLRSPAVYAAAARQAERLSALDADRGFVALEQFQSALALTARLVRVHSLDAARAETLVTALAAVPLDEDRHYAGGVARWVTDALLPAIGGAGDADARLLASLSGTPPAARGETPIVWEGSQYLVDLAGPERRRLAAVRDKLDAQPVARALEIERLASQLTVADISLADVKSATVALSSLLTSTSAPPKHPVLPPGVDEPEGARELLNRAVRVLSKISTPKDLKNAMRAAEPLSILVDDALGDALTTWAYALDLGDPAGAPLLAGNVSRRHDFGFAEKDGELRVRLPWTEPETDVAPGVPWHVRGSLLGLDLGLASLALRRTTSDPLTHPPVLTATDRATFARTVALLNPLDLRDADRDALAAAIERGRARVEALAPDRAGLDAVADAIAMDGWRRRAVGWSLVASPDLVGSFFSLGDLLVLGAPPSSLDRWGVDSGPTSGCLCTRFPTVGRWPLFVGRPASGVFPTQVIDLNLRVVLALRERQLPAALAPGVLAAATQDFIDDVQPSDDNDWLTLVRTAQALGRDRLDDYVASLTANGPLVPARAASGWR